MQKKQPNLYIISFSTGEGILNVLKNFLKLIFSPSGVYVKLWKNDYYLVNVLPRKK